MQSAECDVGLKISKPQGFVSGVQAPYVFWFVHLPVACPQVTQASEDAASKLTPEERKKKAQDLIKSVKVGLLDLTT